MANRLLMLSQQHETLRRRTARQRRGLQHLSDGDDLGRVDTANKAWSDTVDDALGLARQITLLPAHDIEELAFKFEAIWWWARLDDSVLDAELVQWLARFRRDLRRLARKSG